MLGATPITAILGSGVDPRDPDAMRAFVRTACQAGMAIMFIQPGTKEPADLRTPQKRNADNRAAREAARLAGRRDWERVRAPAGLALATTDATTALRYLDRYIETYSTYGNDDGSGNQVEPYIIEYPAVNVAVEVGRSNLVVVDCDTAEQVAEFLAMAGAPPETPPTVRSPGKRLPDGTWAHRDGGHFYFTVPPGATMPSELGAMNLGETGFAVLWSNRYVLIPPSVRAEGAYELTGRDYSLPDWLRVAADARASGRRERAERRHERDDDDVLSSRIDTWAQEVSWESVLEPLGWVPVSQSDSCGCAIWTGPGDHASPKSATAHDAGCALGWDNDANAPLHIWTDHPGEPFETWIAANHGLQTLTKFQAVALTEYDGNQAQMMDALGLGEQMFEVEDLGDVRTMVVEEDSDPANLNTVAEEVIAAVAEVPGMPDPTQMSLAELAGGATAAAPAADEGDDTFPAIGATDAATGLYIPRSAGMPEIAPFGYWADLPAPEFIIDGLIEHGGLSSVIGPPGVGKSSVVLDMAAHIATGRTWQGRRTLKTRVLYMPGEGLAGVVQRIGVWGEARSTTVGSDLLLGRSVIQLAASREAWAELREFIAREEIGLVIFDTFARMATNIDENSATDVGKAIKRFDQVREMTNAGVMVVHHTAKATPDVGRGSSALNGALDSELVVRTGGERVPVGDRWAKPLHLRTTKQKNAEYDDTEIDLLMVNWNDRAPLITGPTGTIDPMQGDVLMARPVPEPVVETAIRIRVFAERFTEQGVTRTDIAAGVAPDAYTESRPNTASAWRMKVAEAVDRALRYGLIETLTGTPSGSRYIPGPATPAQARQQAGDEVMDAGNL